jgi:adenylate cyclase
MIVLVAALIFFVSYIGSTRSLLLLSKNLTTEVSKSIGEKLTALLDSAENTNAEIAWLISHKVIGLDDGQALMDLAANYAVSNDTFSNVAVSNILANKYQGQLAPDNSIVQRSYVRDDKQVTTTYYLGNPSEENKKLYKGKVQDLVKGYDPRTRPWWKLAETAGKTAWTEIYVSGTSKSFVLTCATPIYDAAHSLMGVSTVDINIVSLSRFLGYLKIFEQGRAFIVDDKNKVIAVPIKTDAELDALVKPAPEGSSEPFVFYDIAELPDTNIRTAMASWNARKDKATVAEYEFTGSDGIAYIANLIDFPYRPESHFTIGILVPKDDIFGAINENSLIVFLIILASLVIAVAIGILLSRRISRSLSKLAVEVGKVSRLELDSNEDIATSISEVANINTAVENMKMGLRSFKKYVPADLVRQLNDMKKEALLGGEKKTLSIFFSDIADFTTISEMLSPEALVDNLGHYFHGMSSTIVQNGGTVDKYIGDAIMAFWGAPVDRSNHASLACQSALKCQEYLDGLAAEFGKTGKPVFHTRIGLHTGDVIVGNIGYEERMNYTIIGDSVNLASRLEGLNKYYGTRIMISDETLALVKGEFVTRRLDTVAVKGKSKGVTIHELAGRVDGLAAGRLEGIRLHNHAMDLYFMRQWREALPIFEELFRASDGRDLAAGMMVERCGEYLANPPDGDWNGVYVFHAK